MLYRIKSFTDFPFKDTANSCYFSQENVFLVDALLVTPPACRVAEFYIRLVSVFFFFFVGVQSPAAAHG